MLLITCPSYRSVAEGFECQHKQPGPSWRLFPLHTYPAGPSDSHAIVICGHLDPMCLWRSNIMSSSSVRDAGTLCAARARSHTVPTVCSTQRCTRSVAVQPCTGGILHIGPTAQLAKAPQGVQPRSLAVGPAAARKQGLLVRSSSDSHMSQYITQ